MGGGAGGERVVGEDRVGGGAHDGEAERCERTRVERGIVGSVSANRKGLGPFCRRDDIDGEEEITHLSFGRRFSCIAIVTAEGSGRSNWYGKRQG